MDKLATFSLYAEDDGLDLHDIELTELVLTLNDLFAEYGDDLRVDITSEDTGAVIDMDDEVFYGESQRYSLQQLLELAPYLSRMSMITFEDMPCLD